jgi:SAM-dependent methyltransferase
MGFCVLLLASALSITLLGAEGEGFAAYQKFQVWRATQSKQLADSWDATVEAYRSKLQAEGMSAGAAERTLRLVAAHDEATLYDPAFAQEKPPFQTEPNRLLVEAVKGRKAGTALDVAMGQGRNALFLARGGWNVTGFDVSAVGLEKARALAAKAGLRLQAVHASHEEFDFGTSRWDLVALLYPIEKRSVFKVREALRPSGLVVIECALRTENGPPSEYAHNELLEIFAGFRILKYEEPLAMHDWAQKRMKLVRLIAQKPN